MIKVMKMLLLYYMMLATCFTTGFLLGVMVGLVKLWLISMGRNDHSGKDGRQGDNYQAIALFVKRRGPINEIMGPIK